MAASPTSRAWMTRSTLRIPASSGLPVAQAAPCVLDLLGRARHQTQLARKATI